MAVGVVAGDAAAQPKNVRHAEIFKEDLFVVRAAKPRIAFLRFTEQTFLGSKKRTEAIHFNAAAFKHHLLAAMMRFPEGHFQLGNEALRRTVVFFPIAIFCPGVEMPVSERDAAPGVLRTSIGSAQLLRQKLDQNRESTRDSLAR